MHFVHGSAQKPRPALEFRNTHAEVGPSTIGEKKNRPERGDSKVGFQRRQHEELASVYMSVASLVSDTHHTQCWGLAYPPRPNPAEPRRTRVSIELQFAKFAKMIASQDCGRL